MGTYPQIKFYRGVKADVEAQSPAKGSIWFNTENGSINIKGESTWESYSGYRDVAYNEETHILTFTKADNTTKTVTISGFVSDGDYSNFYKEFTDFVAAQAQIDAEQSALIDANKNAIADLLGDDKNTDGTPTSSIRQIIVDELAAQLLNENGAVDNFKTLQELAAWLEQHPEDAAAMNATLSDHGTAISELQIDVSDLNTAIETINTTIEENELVTSSALTNLDERVIALEGSAVTSVTGESYITAETVDGTVTVKATIATMESGDAGIALASDVRSYVDSQWEWGLF